MIQCGHEVPRVGCACCDWHMDLINTNPEYAPLFGMDADTLRKRHMQKMMRKNCIHLGEVVRRCGSCAGIPVFACAKFGECVTQDGGPVRSCQSCPAYDAGVFTIDQDPIRGPEEVKGKIWSETGKALETHLHALQELANRDFGSPPNGGGGRGFIICGGRQYWPGMAIACHMIRRCGHKEPIEIWHRGYQEPVNIKDIEGLENIRIIDATKVRPRPRILRGWESKLFAITNTELDTVCYLDADAYLVGNVTDLFDRADREGFLFWQDLPGWNDLSVKWGRVWPKGPRQVPSVQGGQLFFNRNLIWKELQIAHWMNQHSDYYYSHMYGDQDTYRVAFAVTGKSFTNLGIAPWPKGSSAFVCDYQYTPRIVHRCQGKLFRIEDIPDEKPGKYTSPNYIIPREIEVFNLFAKIVSADSDPKKIFPAIYKKNIWDGGSGHGSRFEESKLFVRYVNRLIRDQGFKTVVDAGCGDGRVGRRIVAAKYTGVDLQQVLDIPKPEWLAPHQESHSYLGLDIVSEREKIPDADLLIMKDVIHHWPTAVVLDWLKWAQESRKWKKIIVSHDRNQLAPDADCHLGGYRALSHKMAPLNQLGPSHVMDYLHKEIVTIPVISPGVVKAE